MILIVDFGSQTTHLIGRRIREMGVAVKIIPAGLISEKLLDSKITKGIILSGGPASVYEHSAPKVNKNIFYKNIPVLGICYGLQLIAYLLGGKVISGKKEFGHAELLISDSDNLFIDLPRKLDVWVSHGDEVVKIPTGFRTIASTVKVKNAVIADFKRKIFGVQFHPEVHHTPQGRKILENFVIGICGEKAKDAKTKIEHIIKALKSEIKKERAVCALSGGIDSAVSAVFAQKAIGSHLTCFYVDTGFMRLGETEEIVSTFKKHFKLNLKVIYAEDIFLEKLKGVVDPEKKRRIIGETFIRIFEEHAKKIGAKFLVQGTIYPDVIESRGTKHASKIKTHHNVGGLPEKHGFKIIEPLRMFYKDEVREFAKKLGFPKEMIFRHVFPGPGLAVRIIGEVTSRKLEILRKADAIVVSEIKKAGFYDKVWMAFAVFTGIKTTGVVGDSRKYGETIAIRVIESKDTMTANWVRLPYNLLAQIANRITAEAPEVVRVVYDITTKPPGTMEWE